jgi:hypothetical protein
MNQAITPMMFAAVLAGSSPTAAISQTAQPIAVADPAWAACGDEMPDWVANKAARLERIRAAKATLEAEAKKPPPQDDDGPGPSSGMMKSGKPDRGPGGRPPDRAQRNFTDPDSRIQPMRSGAVIAGYNAQVAVDGAHQIIVAQRLQTSPTDARALAPLLADIRAVLRTNPKEVSADAGYCNENNRPISPAAGSPPIWLPAGHATARNMLPVRGAGPKDRARPPWPENSSSPAGAAATVCESRSLNRCSATSNMPEASASSSCAASTTSEPSGR